MKKKEQKEKKYIEQELKIYKDKFTSNNCLVITNHKISSFDLQLLRCISTP